MEATTSNITPEAKHLYTFAGITFGVDDHREGTNGTDVVNRKVTQKPRNKVVIMPWHFPPAVRHRWFGRIKQKGHMTSKDARALKLPQQYYDLELSRYPGYAQLLPLVDAPHMRQAEEEFRFFQRAARDKQIRPEEIRMHLCRPTKGSPFQYYFDTSAQQGSHTLKEKDE